MLVNVIIEVLVFLYPLLYLPFPFHLYMPIHWEILFGMYDLDIYFLGSKGVGHNLLTLKIYSN